MYQLLNHRKDGFKLMADKLFTCNSPLIVETGCARQENNFNGDGMSTLIWNAIAERTSGTVYSVDINQSNVNFAQSKVGPRTIVTCSDSVPWLQNLENTLLSEGKTIDVLYLDSYDFEKHNPHPSSLHHILELLSIKRVLKTGSLIAVDDNWHEDGKHIGKGQYVNQWMTSVSKKLVHNGYQMIWEW